MSDATKMDLPKRVSKPNKRYISEVQKFCPKKGSGKSKSSKIEALKRNCSKKVTTKTKTLKETVKEVKSLGKVEPSKRSGPNSYEKAIATVPDSKNAMESNISRDTVQRDSLAVARELKSLIEIEIAKPPLPSEIAMNIKASEDNESKKIPVTCKTHKRKKNLKKPKKFTIDCSDVDFVNVNDVVRIYIKPIAL